MDTEKSPLCPSARCEKNSILLGIVKKDGRIAFANKKILIDDDFVQIARKGRPPEKRFRFANTCIKSGCQQWKANRCGVVDDVIRILYTEREITELPSCPIRPECRWYHQQGSKACTVCPEIITNLLQTD